MEMDKAKADARNIWCLNSELFRILFNGLYSDKPWLDSWPILQDKTIEKSNVWPYTVLLLAYLSTTFRLCTKFFSPSPLLFDPS